MHAQHEFAAYSPPGARSARRCTVSDRLQDRPPGHVPPPELGSDSQYHDRPQAVSPAQSVRNVAVARCRQARGPPDRARWPDRSRSVFGAQFCLLLPPCGASGRRCCRSSNVPPYRLTMSRLRPGTSGFRCRVNRKVVSAGHKASGRPRMARSRRGSCLIFRMVAAILVWPAWRMSPIARLRKVTMMRGRDAVRTRDASSRNVTSRIFSRGGARLAELDLRVSAGQQLVVMKLPDATGVVQRSCGVLCQRVAAAWLSRVISSRLAARAAASSSSRSSSCSRRSAACCS
jgi:hypothetical protein